MLKYLLIGLLLLGAGTVFAQKKSVINLVSSESTGIIKINGASVTKVYKGVFKQEFSTLISDSAYIYPATNTFDAFGHVIITQGDTLHIFADKLNYNANTKIALLTDNVRMVDKDATLTTNYLTYNTATRVGNYTGGGKLVNKDNTLVSKNGYYFAFSRDSYFRYDVVLTTADALIKTDTLRYNTGSRIAYFYGPTNIYGTKDKDTLYTENGLYNTVVEQAFFGKKNLYKSGTKSLKGDSLFYDKLKGYGRAVKNITFTDTEQKMTLKGDLGEYYKAQERAVVTQNAYVVLVTETKDSTRTDSIVSKPLVTNKDGKPTLALPKNSILLLKAGAGKLPADSAGVAKAVKDNSQQIAQQLNNNKALLNAAKQKAIKDSARIKAAVTDQLKQAQLTVPKNLSSVKPADLLKAGADTARLKALVNGKNSKPTISAAKNKKAATAADKATATVTDLKPSDKVKRDSIYMSADTLETRMTTYKDYRNLQEQRRLAGIIDTSVKIRRPKVVEKPSKFLSARTPSFVLDTSFFNRNFFASMKPLRPVDTVKLKAMNIAAAKKKRITDSVETRKRELDPVYARSKVTLSDTSRIRVLTAHHNARLFKSDLQAKADSMFYSGADSTIRCYVKPMIWTQGSQLSGDTIYLQMKNKKLDNMDMFLSSFIVSIEKGDSTHFNQAGGKRMKGYFKDNKLDRMYIDGNAESIFFKRDSGVVTELDRSVSGRLYIFFKDGAASRAGLLFKAEVNFYPIAKVKEDDKILKGFIWKPKDRPASKEAIIHASRSKSVIKKATGKTPAGAKPADNLKILPAAKDSLGKIINDKNNPAVKTGKDSTQIISPNRSKPTTGLQKDSVIKPVAPSKNQPEIKPKSTTTIKADNR